jgi:phage terminase small subunit
MTEVALNLTERVNLGPAMTVLPRRRRLFCLAYMRLGASNARGYGDGKAAAIAAGYSEHSATNIAYQLLLDKRVQAALIELGQAEFASLGPTVIARLKDLTAMPEHKDHYNALKFVAAQAGHREIRETIHTVVMTEAEKIEKLKTLALETGEDPAKWIGPNVLEGEYEDITQSVLPPGEEY